MQATVIEQSAKRYKGAMLASVCIALGGPLLVGLDLISPANGAIAFAAGLVMLVFSIVARWWHHG